ALWRLFLVTLKCTCARADCPALRTLCRSISCFPADIPLLREGSDGRYSTGRSGVAVQAPPGLRGAGCLGARVGSPLACAAATASPHEWTCSLA
ncbi:hypothetical protein Nmel_001247, partial [Mimus melanotis]